MKTLTTFPFLFGGTFIEADGYISIRANSDIFPFLLGGTFIEADSDSSMVLKSAEFPFLFGGTFIEAGYVREDGSLHSSDFPSFSEGLSLRAQYPR